MGHWPLDAARHLLLDLENSNTLVKMEKSADILVITAIVIILGLYTAYHLNMLNFEQVTAKYIEYAENHPEPEEPKSLPENIL